MKTIMLEELSQSVLGVGIRVTHLYKTNLGRKKNHLKLDYSYYYVS